MLPNPCLCKDRIWKIIPATNNVNFFLQFYSSEFQERTLERHLEICGMLEDVENAVPVQENLSTTYGVNKKSVLVNVKHFDVCQCFAQDIMHILLEGVVPYETKLLLRFLIDNKRLFTLRDLNRKLDSFEYGYMNSKNKPSPIARETLNAASDTKLKQSGKQ